MPEPTVVTVKRGKTWMSEVENVLKCFAGASPRDIVHPWRCQREISTVLLFEPRQKKKKTHYHSFPALIFCLQWPWCRLLFFMLPRARVGSSNYSFNKKCLGVRVTTFDSSYLDGFCWSSIVTHHPLSSLPCSRSFIPRWDPTVGVSSHLGPWVSLRPRPNNPLAGSKPANMNA